MSTSSDFTSHKLVGPEVTSTVLEDAASLFSAHYGVWGPLAARMMGSFAQQGRRVRMSASKLRNECLPASENAEHTYVKAMVGDRLVGNVFATRWISEGRPMCWITQLVVVPEFRNMGLATKMLLKLREDGEYQGFGILSSHPFAIMACLRAFGRGVEGVDFSMTKDGAISIMSSCPVRYVRTAKLQGSLFGDDDKKSKVVSCADTGFWVDHTEPSQALDIIKAKGIKWPFGTLPEGHEFLVLVDGRS
ncbi:hypothetical protein KVT40_003986 [Elsinoe batatas]|uniref:N-acetyltransferase domain-containing protein n=1 Tax=Elsinoe batatas TaxID=2601811 RepID=A0A8K0L4Q2_9PEZI|nr:hypothetical protein KVT40_003986 [Elsinoe batatas]